MALEFAALGLSFLRELLGTPFPTLGAVTLVLSAPCPPLIWFCSPTPGMALPVPRKRKGRGCGREKETDEMGKDGKWQDAREQDSSERRGQEHI